MIEPLLVDVKTACTLLSVKKTKLFELCNRKENGLQRVKIGRRTVITMRSIHALIEKGAA